VHHGRKATGDDWMDSTSGTNGLNGSADFTVNLSRDRNSEEGLIRVTGRDIIEGEYSVTVSEGEWILNGDSLHDAAVAAEQGKATQNLGDFAASIIRYVTDHGPVSPKQVEAAVQLPGSTVRSYLTRAVDAGRLQKHGRGLYGAATSAASATTGD